MSDTKNIYQALRAVQLELKAPKNQRNNFGNYNYRSCEDILEAVKPVLDKHGLTLIVTDQLKSIGDRYYVEAEATVTNGQDAAAAYGFAREEETKKGMDGSQITGAASSYARKYALNGLFLIDDTKDADTNEHRQAASQSAPKPQPAPAPKSPEQHVRQVFPEKLVRDVVGDEVANAAYAAPPKGTEVTDAQLKRMMAHFNEMGVKDRDERLAYVTAIVRRTVSSSKELTRGEAVKVIDKQLHDINDKGEAA